MFGALDSFFLNLECFIINGKTVGLKDGIGTTTGLKSSGGRESDRNKYCMLWGGCSRCEDYNGRKSKSQEFCAEVLVLGSQDSLSRASDS